MKLSVGSPDVVELRAWQASRVLLDPPLRHLTRHMPKRAADITAGGSIYWVVAGAMLVRQRVTAIEPALRPDGSPCTAILLDPALVPVIPRPVKAFQGWRYLRTEDAPADLDPASAEAALPPDMARRLRELCLI